MRGAWQCAKHTLGSEAILLWLLSLLRTPVLTCTLCSHGSSPCLRYVLFYPWTTCSVRLDKELINVSQTPSNFWIWNKEKDTIRKKLRGERKPIGECSTLRSPESHLGLGDSRKHDACKVWGTAMSKDCLNTRQSGTVVNLKVQEDRSLYAPEEGKAYKTGFHTED